MFLLHVIINASSLPCIIIFCINVKLTEKERFLLQVCPLICCSGLNTNTSGLRNQRNIVPVDRLLAISHHLMRSNSQIFASKAVTKRSTCGKLVSMVF